MELRKIAAIKQHVGGDAFQVPSLDDDVFRSKVADRSRGLFHLIEGPDFASEERTRLMLEVYRSFLEEDMAIPVIPGRKSDSQKFPGALRTYTVEAMMGDGRALQAGTSHNLGDHFAHAYDILYLDENNERQSVGDQYAIEHRSASFRPPSKDGVTTASTASSCGPEGGEIR